MINHYVTLVKIVGELGQELPGSRFTGAFSFRKNEFHLLFSGNRSIGIYLYPSRPFLFLDVHPGLPGKNVAPFFKAAEGLQVRSVTIHESDRLIKIGLDQQTEIVIRVYSASAGIGLYKDYRLVDSIRSNEPVLSEGNWLDPCGMKEPWPFLKAGFQTLIGRFKPDLITHHSSLSHIMPWTGYWIYHHPSKPDTELILPFRIPEYQEVRFIQSGSAGFRKAEIGKKQEQTLQSRKTQALRQVEDRLNRLKQTLLQLSTLVSGDHKSIEEAHLGHLLQTVPDQDQRGLPAITVSDWATENGIQRTIKLTPSLTIRENAVRYFDRSKRMKQTISEKRLILQKTKESIGYCEELLLKLASAGTWPDLQPLLKQVTKQVGQTSAVESTEPFHRFPSRFGYDILVGKHAKGNDFLLTKVAGKNDIWLHCRGDSGSHVILPNRQPVFPGKAQLEEAAALAAWFSKQQKSDWVPVSYTFTKHVRKPKQAAPGAVILEREEVLFVSPRPTT